MSDQGWYIGRMCMESSLGTIILVGTAGVFTRKSLLVPSF